MNFKFLKHYAPPGMNLQPELCCLIFGIGTSILYSMTFLVRYFEQREALYARHGNATLMEGVVMNDFYVLLGLDGTYSNVLTGFMITAIVMITTIPLYYVYYRQGSKSIYLMKRLPNRGEIHKRALVLPIAAVLCCAAAAFLITMLYFTLYMLGTPAVCIQPGQWGKLWGGFR